MLKVKIKMNGEELTLQDLEPGEGPRSSGSITDYGVSGNQIIHFFHPTVDTAYVLISKKGATVEQGMLRATFSEQMEQVAEIKQGEEFELPFKSKYGEAILCLTIV
jgi:hypothetical protein